MTFCAGNVTAEEIAQQFPLEEFKHVLIYLFSKLTNY